MVVGIVLLFVHIRLGGDTLRIYRHRDCRTIGDEDMTAQEKAKELVDKFDGVGLQQRNEAIACSLIAVDEILDAIDWHEFETPNLQMWFWDAVKKEIELL